MGQLRDLNVIGRACRSLSILRGTVMGVLVLFSPILVQASPESLTYQGRIVKSDGAPLESASVSFLFEITNSSGSCVIYREQVNGINMINSNGMFDVKIGAGHSYPASGSFTILDSFNNGGSFTCDGGVVYTAGLNDERRLKVQFHDGTGWKTISPDSIIRAVPFSAYSNNSNKVGGHLSSDFVLKTDVNTNTTCDSGSFITWNASTQKFGCAAAPAGGGGSPTGGAGGDLAGNYPSPVLATMSGLTAGTYGSATLIPEITVDAKGRITTITTHSVPSSGVPAASGASGKYLKSNGTSWAGHDITFGDIKNSVGASAFNGMGTCTAAQTVKWSALTDSFECQNIGSLSASTITGGLNSFLPSQTSQAGKVLQTDGTNASWQTPASGSQWITTGSHIYYDAGRVGIGTSTPERQLSIASDASTSGAAGISLVHNTLATAAQIDVKRAGGSLTTPSTFTVGADLFGIYARTYNGSTYDLAAGMVMSTDSFGVNPGGRLSFFTTPGATTSYTERMTILGNGRVGIGTNNPGTNLEVAGTVKITGGSPGLGKVLTSDAAGLASWQAVASVTETDPKVGANTADFVSKWNGTALVASKIFDNGTEVGIGTAAPFTPLHVAIPVAKTTVGTTEAFTISTNDAGAYHKFYVTLTGGADEEDRSVNLQTAEHFAGNFGVLSLQAAGGSVGIGTSTPTEALEVSGKVKADEFCIAGACINAWPSGGSSLPTQSTHAGKFLQTDGTNASWVSVTDTGITALTGDVTASGSGSQAATIAAGAVNSSKILDSSVSVADLNFIGTMAVNTGLLVRDATQFHNLACVTVGHVLTWTATGWSCAAAGASSESDPQVGANTTNYMSKWDGSALIASGIIESSGNVGIGTASPSEKLHVSGNVMADSYVQTSDRRLKRNIATIDGLKIVRQLRGVKYQRIASGKDEYGLIAQEVEAVAPEFVVTRNDGIKAVHYQNLVSPLIEAVKQVDLQCRQDNQDLQKEIADLKSEMAETKKQLQEMKELIRGLASEKR